ncbi:MAG TPA: signal peptidase I [Methanomassiliicoccales archaeon]|nr:signal peptidase I [Methanomassiliicoccales archaeon]
MRRKFVLNATIKVVLILICTILLIPCLVNIFPPIAGADSSYVVIGGSMIPTLNPGDVILVKEVDPEAIEIGDIVTVDDGSKVYTHRVVDKRVSDDAFLFQLKGDANDGPDPIYVDEGMVVGKYQTNIPTGFVQTWFGYLLLIFFPVMILATHQAIKIYRIYSNKSRRRGLEFIVIKGRRKTKIEIVDTITVLLLVVILVGNFQLLLPYLALGG